jgi:hypothetical protein
MELNYNQRSVAYSRSISPLACDILCTLNTSLVRGYEYFFHHGLLP